jgi:hypothetical protein
MLGEHFYSNLLEVLAPDPWTAAFDIVPAGPVTLGHLRFGADVRIRFGELGAYHVDVPLSGELAWRQGRGEAMVATTETAAVFQPVGNTTLERWEGDCHLLAVKIDRGALESELARMLDEPVGAPVQLGPELVISHGAGATWLRLARLLAADAAEEQGGPFAAWPRPCAPMPPGRSRSLTWRASPESARAPCRTASNAIWARHRWLICVRSGCRARTGSSERPGPGRTRSRRSPTGAASCTWALTPSSPTADAGRSTPLPHAG